jgi:hypothetical protein
MYCRVAAALNHTCNFNMIRRFTANAIHQQKKWEGSMKRDPQKGVPLRARNRVLGV